MSFETIYTKKALKNLNKYKKKNKTTYKQILEGIAQIEENPFKSANKQLESIKCLNCKRHQVGKYRIVLLYSYKIKYYRNTKCDST